MQKIKETKLIKFGYASYALVVPKVWANDNNFIGKEPVDVYRDTINGKDCLIIVPKEKEEKNGNNN